MDNILIPSLNHGDSGKFIQLLLHRGHRTYPLLRTSSDPNEAHSALIRRALLSFSHGFQMGGQEDLEANPPRLTSLDYVIRGMGFFDVTPEGFIAYGQVSEYAHVPQNLNTPNPGHFSELARWVPDFRFRIDPTRR